MVEDELEDVDHLTLSGYHSADKFKLMSHTSDMDTLNVNLDHEKVLKSTAFEYENGQHGGGITS